ncbi:hypothetical protein ATCC51561_1084 [Campylobacter concisus ATCC 51561]|nr:hypothetical protein ATCC51561_1084 [Campylobacter concisus ATCC 51561]
MTRNLLVCAYQNLSHLFTASYVSALLKFDWVKSPSKVKFDNSLRVYKFMVLVRVF